MANFGKDRDPEPVIPKISQETLAEMVGFGFVEYNGEMKVHSSLLNIVLHD
jgi:CRP/FNR family cyclic AMP-dependent transcriptional regulator